MHVRLVMINQLHWLSWTQRVEKNLLRIFTAIVFYLMHIQSIYLVPVCINVSEVFLT